MMNGSEEHEAFEPVEEPTATVTMPGMASTETHFSKTLADLKDADAESARAYIQALLEVAANDAKVNTTLATVEVAGIVFLVKDSLASIQRADIPAQIAAAVTISCLAMSACFLPIRS